MLTDVHKMQAFLEWYHRDGDEILNHIVPVIDDETWVSFMNVGSQRAVRAVDAHTFTRQAEKA
jgi:hypothetical protein